MSNYENVDGATVAVWDQTSDDIEPESEATAHIEEMYFQYGDLVVTLTVPDEDRFYDVKIPVKAKDSWNEFVESMPTWDT